MTDVSALTYFAPIAMFLLIFLVVFAILHKTKVLGENKWIHLFVGLLIASLFISFGSAREYVQTIVPWVAVLLISLFFVLLIIGFAGKPMDFMTKGIGIAFFVVLIIIFLVSAYFVFSHVVGPYMPWSTHTGISSDGARVTGWIYSSRVVGAVVLIVISAIVAWILTKK